MISRCDMKKLREGTIVVYNPVDSKTELNVKGTGFGIKLGATAEIIDLTIEGETRRLEWQNRSQANLHSDAENNLRAALGVAAVQIDDVMSRYFGNKPYADKNEEEKAKEVKEEPKEEAKESTEKLDDFFDKDEDDLFGEV